MANKVPERLADLLTREKKAFAHLSLVCADETPRVWPIWFDYDGEHIILNTARGRLKDRIMSRRPVASLSISDPANPYRYMLITGPVVYESEEGGYAGISDLNVKYHGHPNYPKNPGEVRVVYKIAVENVFPKA